MSTIGDALFGSTRQAVLRLFFSNSDRRYYLRDVIRRLNIGTGNVQKELAGLTKAGILNRTPEGNQVYYQANLECPIFAELRSICSKTFGIAETLQEALGPIAAKIRFAFIYGSIAAGTENSDSDIDLMIVADTMKPSEVIARLSQVSKSLSREVNPTIYRPDEFFQKIGQRKHFISTVMDGPKIFVVGSMGELRGMAKEGLAEGSPKQPRRDRKSR